MRSLAGTGTLVRLALRRDRIRLAIWVVALVVVTLGTASAFKALYPTTASRLPFGCVRIPSSSRISRRPPRWWRPCGVCAVL